MANIIQKNNNYYREERLKVVRNPARFPFDLTTQKGRVDFEKKITEIHNKCPGVVVPLGEKLDFQKVYENLNIVAHPEKVEAKK